MFLMVDLRRGPMALLLFVTVINLVAGQVFYYQPEQVHLSFGESTSEIVVTWSTMTATNESIVEYGIGGFALRATGTEQKFVDGGSKKHTQYIHRVVLRDLQPSSRYEYHCGSTVGWSPEFYFHTVPDGSDWAPSLAIFGDMGNENAQSMARLQEDTQRHMYDAIIHVGDFAYDMNSEDALVGDQFMNQIQSIAAYTPYMVCAGNHEEKYNFSNYRARFSMPSGTDNMMYSFNLGPVHFIGFSTEVYYFMNYGLKTLINQYEWLRRDLEEANKPENRAQRPWIVTYGHRPMYCSNDNDNDCTHSETLVRVGLPFTHWFGLEDLFYEYGVDVEIWAHEHSYERLWPIYDYKLIIVFIAEGRAFKPTGLFRGLSKTLFVTEKIYNGSHEEPYRNPRAPVHLVTGSAGCKEGREPFLGKIPEWSAIHSQDYGYTRMKALNRTHLYFEQISVDKEGAVIDSFTIVKDLHVPYKQLFEVPAEDGTK